MRVVVDRVQGQNDPVRAERIRARDEEALCVVVHRYLPQVLRAARAAGLSAEDAEDVTHDTFVTFIESAARFEGRSHVRTWVFGILYRKISAARRALRRKREREVDQLGVSFENRFDEAGRWKRPPREAEIPVDTAQIRAGIESCLGGVPTRQRMAFVLREVEELETAEICKILEVTRTKGP